MRPLLAVLEGAIPMLIKIDVEGFEWSVLTASTEVLQNPDCQALIVEINGAGRRYGIQDEQIDALIRSYGFTPMSYEPRRRELTRLERHGTHNTIYVRDINAVAARLKAHPGIKVHGERF